METNLKPLNPSSATWRLLCLNPETILELGIRPNYEMKDINWKPRFQASGISTPCGDKLTFGLCTHNGFITDLFHWGHSCCMTTALADILCHNLTGHRLDSLISVSTDIVKMCVPLNRAGCIRLPFDLLRELHAATKTQG